MGSMCISRGLGVNLSTYAFKTLMVAGFLELANLIVGLAAQNPSSGGLTNYVIVKKCHFDMVGRSRRKCGPLSGRAFVGTYALGITQIRCGFSPFLTVTIIDAG